MPNVFQGTPTKPVASYEDALAALPPGSNYANILNAKKNSLAEAE